tara:strand:- start:171580 stop:172140 length:561 start_codon:yes stop_codon:yes gene_type:complete
VKVKETNLSGCFVIDPTVFEDDRGCFFESFNKKVFLQETGLNLDFVQNNISVSKKGVVRGLHMQKGAHAQAKLVEVIKGVALDVVVDVRTDSETFGESFACIISEENKRQIFIPKGFLHGFTSLEEDTILSYKCDAYYNKNAEIGVRYDDEDLGIDWKMNPEEIELSEKDKGLGSFSDLKKILFHK